MKLFNNKIIIQMEILNLQYHLEIASCIFQSLYGYMCFALHGLISLHYAAQVLSTDQISGFCLTTTLTSLILLAFCHGLNQALNINVAQALGHKDKQLGLRYLNITIYSQIICATLIGLASYFLIPYSSFLIVENGSQVATYGRELTVYIVLSSFLHTLYESQKLYFIANKILTPFKYIHTVTLFTHILNCYFLMIYWNLGIPGLGCSLIITEFSNLLLLMVYQKAYHPLLYEGFTFKVLIFQNLQFFFEYFKNAWNNIVHIFADYFIFTVIQMLSFRMGNSKVNAQIALSNTSGLFFKFPLCTAITIQTFVGHELTKYQIIKAKTYTTIALIQYNITVTILLLLLWIFQSYWVDVYTANPYVQEQLLEVLPYFLLGCILIDGYQGVMTGILKGLEKADKVSIATLVSYYIIGVPLMHILAFQLDWQLKGLWLGLGCANLALILYYVYELSMTDWQRQADLVVEKLKDQQGLVS